MSAWAWFWTIVFFLTLAVYAGIAVWVTIAGYRDLLRLRTSLHKTPDDPE